jgi:mRNA interferase RelE/StbE
VLAFIESIKEAKTLSEIPNIKKLKGYKDFYRFKFSAYRIGFQSKGNTVILITVQHRKEIYRKFP